MHGVFIGASLLKKQMVAAAAAAAGELSWGGRNRSNVKLQKKKKSKDNHPRLHFGKLLSRSLSFILFQSYLTMLIKKAVATETHTHTHTHTCTPVVCARSRFVRVVWFDRLSLLDIWNTRSLKKEKEKKKKNICGAQILVAAVKHFSIIDSEVMQKYLD